MVFLYVSRAVKQILYTFVHNALGRRLAPGRFDASQVPLMTMWTKSMTSWISPGRPISRPPRLGGADPGHHRRVPTLRQRPSEAQREITHGALATHAPQQHLELHLSAQGLDLQGPRGVRRLQKRPCVLGFGIVFEATTTTCCHPTHHLATVK